MLPPRLLLVLTFDPWPIRSGITRRLDALARALDAASDLTIVICDVEPGHGQPPIAGRILRLRRDPSRFRSIREALRGLIVLRPLTAAFYVRPELRQRLRGLLEEIEPDRVVTHGLGGAELVRGLVDFGNVVFDADTIDPRTYRRIAADLGGLRGLQWRVDAELLPRWHARTLPSFSCVTVTSAEDRDIYTRLAPRANIRVVPNGVDLPANATFGTVKGPLLFVGPTHYPPNRVAVDWLASQLLPLLPGVRLVVVGEGPERPHPRVTHLGFVPDLGSLWQEATALVVPLTSGGGTRLKILEALAYGLPVISTAIGIEGLGAESDFHYLRAESADEFAVQVERLRSDLSLRRGLSKRGRELAMSFAWSQCTRPLVEAATQ